MRVVVDSNRMQSDELASFLRASRSNRAVITDWVMMEAYKGETLKSIYKTLAVVAEFPIQVIVLKNTGMCMRTRVGPQMSKRLIWPEHTEGFPNFIQEIKDAQNGNLLIEQSIIDRGRIANERLIELEASAASIIEHHQSMLETLKPEDIDAIRGRRQPPNDIMSRVHGIIYAFARDYGADLGVADSDLRRKSLLLDFKFRMGSAIASWLLEWIRTGSQKNIRPGKVKNDFVDTMLSAYGTYFNGVMTRDKKLREVYSLNRILLETLNVSCPPPYMAPD